MNDDFIWLTIKSMSELFYGSISLMFWKDIDSFVSETSNAYSDNSFYYSTPLL